MPKGMICMKQNNCKKSGSSYKDILLLILCISFQFALAHSQNAISERVSDNRGTAIGFANVSLLKAADSSLATTVFCDSTGKFSLPAGPDKSGLINDHSNASFNTVRTKRFWKKNQALHVNLLIPLK